MWCMLLKMVIFCPRVRTLLIWTRYFLYFLSFCRSDRTARSIEGIWPPNFWHWSSALSYWHHYGHQLVAVLVASVYVAVVGQESHKKSPSWCGGFFVAVGCDGWCIEWKGQIRTLLHLHNFFRHKSHSWICVVNEFSFVRSVLHSLLRRPRRPQSRTHIHNIFWRNQHQWRRRWCPFSQCFYRLHHVWPYRWLLNTVWSCQ